METILGYFLILTIGFYFFKRTKSELLLFLWLVSIHIPYEHFQLYTALKFCVFLFSLVYVIKRIKKVKSQLYFFSPIILYAILNLFSSLYALDPTRTFLKSIEYLLLISFLISFLESNNSKQINYNISKILFLFCIGAGLTIILDFENTSLTSALISKYPHTNPNSLTQYAVMLIILNTSTSNYFNMGLGWFITILSHSRTSIFGLILFILKTNFSIRRIANMFLILLVLLILFLFLRDFTIEYLLRNQSLDRFLSLTGRIYVWEGVINKGLESPFFGHGFDSSFLFNEKHYYGSIIPSNSDNTYIDVFYFTGFIGLLLILVQTVKFIKQSRNNTILLWLVLIILIRSLTGSTFHVTHVNTILIFLIIGISLKTNDRKTHSVL